MSWLTVNPSSGQNNYNTVFTASENTNSGDSRVTYVTVYNEQYNLSDICTVTQEPRDIETVTLSPSSYNGNYEASSVTVTVTANGNWSATTSYSGISINIQSGTSGTTQVTISFDRNKTLDENSRYVIFKTQDTSTPFEIKQSARQPENNQIFYTTHTEEIIDKWAVSAWTSGDTENWGTKLVSHTYEDFGIMTFNLPLTVIPANAFYKLDSSNDKPAPTRFVISSTITQIGNSAFYCNTYLTKINLGNITYFEDNSFRDAALNMKTDVWCTGLTYIGDYAFYKCRMSSNFINTKLNYIGDYAFWNNYFSELKLPNITTRIFQYAFSNYNRGYLEKIYLDNSTNAASSISVYAFYQAAPVSSGQGTGTLYTHSGYIPSAEGWTKALQNGGYRYVRSW